jgi:hypothetical protein
VDALNIEHNAAQTLLAANAKGDRLEPLVVDGAANDRVPLPSSEVVVLREARVREKAMHLLAPPAAKRRLGTAEGAWRKRKRAMLTAPRERIPSTPRRVLGVLCT